MIGPSAAARGDRAPDRLLSWLVAVRALVGISLREAWRQGLWLVVAAAALLTALAVARAQALDDAARLKLAVTAVGAIMSFLLVVVGSISAAASLRRDIDRRIAISLFATPLARSAYLVGRWLGAVAVLMAAMLVLATTAALAIAWRFPQHRPWSLVVEPSAWEMVSAFGGVTPIPADRQRVILSGPPGNGVRWTLAGLPHGPAAPDHADLLLRADVHGLDADAPVQEALVQVTALPPPPASGAADSSADGTAAAERPIGAQVPILLSVAADSPYGRLRQGLAVPTGEAVLAARGAAQSDLSLDYIHLLLPARCIGSDGRATIQLQRMDSAAVLVLGRLGSLRLAQPGGGVLLNLVRAGCVDTAAAGLVAAVAMLAAVPAGLGVAVLAGLTLAIAGSMLPMLREVASYHDAGQVVQRILDLSLVVIPDLDRGTVFARLAAAVAVPWSVVCSAALVFAGYALVALGIGYLMLRRREL